MPLLPKDSDRPTASPTVPTATPAATAAVRGSGDAPSEAQPRGEPEPAPAGARRRRDGVSVRIRMYRQGLGDCFLLTFPNPSGERPELHVLIDCGVLVGQPDGARTIRAVAANIQEATGGHLDVLVATHQHWDHLSGFVDAKDTFEAMTIDAVWLAWTEDRSNRLAESLRRDRKWRLRALRAAIARLEGTDLGWKLGLGLVELVEFFGESAFGAAGGRTTEAAIAKLQERDDAEVVYLTPGGAPVPLIDLPNVRVYVLGPPEDARLLRRSAPSRRAGEVYDIAPDATAAAAFLAATPAVDSSEEPPTAMPFDTGYRISREQASAMPFFQNCYGFGRDDLDAWRRIDDDWLAAASHLALQLDNDTNNTSLALAFELLPSGRVLLFPGDAQVGNWKSWRRHTWRVEEAGRTREVTVPDLLGRTVLYKVGHHGSHNATLRAEGLERMTSPELVAMVPVDQATAARQRWNMPFPSLLRRLHERTRGRVLRADSGCPSEADLRGALELSRGERERFLTSVRVDDLFIDYHVPL